MADKKENNKPLLPNKPPRGNYQIWVILATVAIIFGVMYFNNSSSLKDVDYDAFKQMVKSGDVKKVVLVQNRKFVEVTLKSEALQNAKYKDQLNNGTFGGTTTGPHFVMKVVDAGNFDQEFRVFRDKLSPDQSPEYKTEDREDYFQVFIQWGFLILLLFGFWMLFHRGFADVRYRLRYHRHRRRPRRLCHGHPRGAARLQDRDRRARASRRHLPQLGLHPDQGAAALGRDPALRPARQGLWPASRRHHRRRIPTAVVDRSRGVSKRLNDGVGFLLKKNKVECHLGRGRDRQSRAK